MNVVEVAFAGTVTDDGIVRAGAVFVRVTNAPPAGAAWVSVTVHTVLLFGDNAAALHDSAPIAVATCRDTVVCAVVAFKVPVRVAV